ncbi:NADPH:quinone reductase [Sulfitobacter donghicola]|uniref:Zinc-binding dehydrogenase n=1 Tax=Sulfitobacter donghicola DSW-25 = KCTC 12864 = JCM 14565 TaxID=1300350 RepID=A0A073IHF4_9RHOB|nr:NADPH:quinone reductase [Sulfitobacter donghicola]KEJ88975.1 zinc-binding dehydrogenase [Sulfitobacter donghicola DSW-25 = KCTC 12864 = JCM 14565]KIN67473.1 Oxidoreductase, zinc-binding dehydrogenase family [Sulfitobacter donghicola DSW-25 = KCTC 12864 = JCM 14565]
MKSICYDRFGKAAEVLNLKEFDTPAPAQGEVTVRLAFSGVNPSDIKARAGSRPGVLKPAFPQVIPHSDGSGIIEAVGEGVSSDRIGQRVWLWNGQWMRAFGTASSHITLPAEQAVAMPDYVALETGAILGIPGLTAAEAVFGAGDVTGQTLLVSGGGGTVGYLAVQLAVWGGAKVIATCSDRDIERVKAAGAHTVLDYRSNSLAEEILAANGGEPVDRILEVEFGVNVQMNADVIKVNGTIAAYGSQIEMAPTLPFGPLLFKAATIDIILIYLLPLAERQERIERLHKALKDGALTCPVATIYPLEECAKAHDAVLAGARTGAILVDCS